FGLLDARDGDRGARALATTLDRGTVRALLGQLLSVKGARFEVQTPAAVVVGRGASMAIWVEERPAAIEMPSDPLAPIPPPTAIPVTTGVANIGTNGRVTLSAAGQTIVIPPGQYAIVGEGRTPTPQAYGPSAGILGIIAATEFKERPHLGSARDTLQAIAGSDAAVIADAPRSLPQETRERLDPFPAIIPGTPTPSVPTTPPAAISRAGACAASATSTAARSAKSAATATDAATSSAVTATSATGAIATTTACAVA